jgi:uncharacterized delta-60 repeat protein
MFRPRGEELEDRTLLSPGGLDRIFGSGGQVTTGIQGSATDLANGVAVQPNGQIVIVGSTGGDQAFGFALTRYNTDGSLDPSFGTAGKVITDFPSHRAQAQAVALQVDGKIVVAGTALGANADFAVARYNADGSLDSTFGSGGLVTTDISAGSLDQAFAVAVQADGKVLVAGTTFGSSRPDFALVRYNADGSLDSSLGAGGIVTTDFAGRDDTAYSIGLQPDQQIVVAGTSFDQSTSTGDFAVARYNADGRLDASFGSSGEVLTRFPGVNASGHSLVLQTDGKIVVAGSSVNLNNSTLSGYALVRYNANGSLDTSFGKNGEALTSVPGADEALPSLALQADGRLVLAATSFDPHGTTQEDFFVARYNTDGSLDASFGTGGTVLTDFHSRADFAGAVAVEADGTIVVAGTARQTVSLNQDFGLARYHADGTLDTSFGTGGRVTTDFIGTSEDEAAGIAIQPNGKIVVAGTTQDFASNGGSEFALTRYNPDGSLDSSFGTGGIVITSFPGNDAFAAALALQPNGKIIVVGTAFVSTGVDFALARYNVDGSLDTSFGKGGEALTHFGGGATSVALQPDGKIVVAGTAFNSASGSGQNFGVVRYNPDGSRDTSFGTAGRVITDFGHADNQAQGVIIEKDGNIVVAGTTGFLGSQHLALVRYLRNGGLDKSFGRGGRVTAAFGEGASQAAGLVLQGGSKLLVVGTVGSYGSRDFALARFLHDGSLDSGFGTGGKVTTDFGTNDAAAGAVVLQPNDRIVVVGQVGNPFGENPTPPSFAVVRYNHDGTLDTTFGKGGRVTTDFGSAPSWATSVAMQFNGKIVAAGVVTSVTTNNDFALARYWPNRTPHRPATQDSPAPTRARPSSAAGADDRLLSAAAALAGADRVSSEAGGDSRNESAGSSLPTSITYTDSTLPPAEMSGPRTSIQTAGPADTEFAGEEGTHLLDRFALDLFFAAPSWGA